MTLSPKFHKWQPEPEICGFSAAISAGDVFLDMTAVEGPNDVECDVIDGTTLLWRERFPTLPLGQRAAEDFSRRHLMKIIQGGAA